jgi:hypothetical protein
VLQLHCLVGPSRRVVVVLACRQAAGAAAGADGVPEAGATCPSRTSLLIYITRSHHPIASLTPPAKLYGVDCAAMGRNDIWRLPLGAAAAVEAARRAGGLGERAGRAVAHFWPSFGCRFGWDCPMQRLSLPRKMKGATHRPRRTPSRRSYFRVATTCAPRASLATACTTAAAAAASSATPPM